MATINETRKIAPEVLIDDEVQLLLTDDKLSAMWQDTAEVEAEVFIECGYVENEAELAEDYLPYVAKSTMLAAKVGGVVVGGVRFIDYDPKIGFKTLNDAAKGELAITKAGHERLAEIDPLDMMEVGTIAISKAFRASDDNDFRLRNHLYGGIYQMGREHDTPYVLASFDADYYNRFIAMFGESVTQLGPAVNYMGSLTIPSVMDTRELYEYLRSSGLTEMVQVLDDAHGKLEDTSSALLFAR